MLMPEKTCTHGTLFLLERSVAVSSPGHGGQVSVSPFPSFRSVVLPWHREYISIAEAILVGNVRCGQNELWHSCGT